MFVCRGAPVNDSTNKTNVSTARVNLDIVMTGNLLISYKVQPVLGYTETGTFGTITNESVVIPGQGTPDVGDSPA